MTSKEKGVIGIAFFALVGIFAIFLIAVLKPEDLSVQGALVIGALIAWGGQIITFFFRKASDAISALQIKALQKRVKTLTAKLKKGVE